MVEKCDQTNGGAVREPVSDKTRIQGLPKKFLNICVGDLGGSNAESPLSDVPLLSGAMTVSSDSVSDSPSSANENAEAD
jgi:hypothetical protein